MRPTPLLNQHKELDVEKTSDQMYGDLLLQLGNPTIVEPDVLVGYLRDVERMHSLGHITAWELDRARKAYQATIERDPRQGPPHAASTSTVGDPHSDPLSGALGAHPIGTGVGAIAGGAAAGAAIGSVAGPLGSMVGVAVGAVVGGLAGKGVAEMIDPSAEEVYRRERPEAPPSSAGSSS